MSGFACGRCAGLLPFAGSGGDLSGFWFRVWGLGFGGEGLGFRGFEFRSGFRAILVSRQSGSFHAWAPSLGARV